MVLLVRRYALLYGAHFRLHRRQRKEKGVALRLFTLATATLVAVIALTIVVSMFPVQAAEQKEPPSKAKVFKAPMWYQPPNSTEDGESIVSPQGSVTTRRCGTLSFFIRDGQYRRAIITFGFNSRKQMYGFNTSYDLRYNRSGRYPGWQRFYGGGYFFGATKSKYWTRVHRVPRAFHTYYGTMVLRLNVAPKYGGGTCTGTIRARGRVT